MDIIITKHAKRRLRKRRGISSGGQKRHVYKAFMEGTTVQSLENERYMLSLYDNFYYIFALCERTKQPVLLTMYRIPSSYLDAFDAHLHSKMLREDRSQASA